ncbi:MAG: helix-turn-helix transcriptional regulator [Gemmatimonadales bacterium]|nr:helix-turn-helix transcriptional regulator [Gemmatimonadales bacterium]
MIVELLARGLTSKEIATRLQISVHTVNCHLRRCFRRLNAHTRAEAVAKAMSSGIVSRFDSAGESAG